MRTRKNLRTVVVPAEAPAQEDAVAAPAEDDEPASKRRRTTRGKQPVAAEEKKAAKKAPAPKKRKAPAKGGKRGKKAVEKEEEEEEEKGEEKGEEEESKADAGDEDNADEMDTTEEAEKKAMAQPSEAAAVAPPAPAGGGKVFEGQTFVVSGEFKMGKARLQMLIQEHGGRIVSAVNKSLSYFVCGESGTTAYGGKTGKGTAVYKQARKMKKPIVDEEWVVNAVNTAPKAVDPIMAELQTFLPTVIAQLIFDYCGPFNAVTAVWDDIVALMDEKDRANLPAPVSAKAIADLEAELKLPLPADVKAFLMQSDGSAHFSIVPSVAEMQEQYNYNDPQKQIYKDLKWIPFGQLDYDFCWKAMDIKTGKIFQLDFECNNYSLEGDSLLSLLQNQLKQLQKKKATGKEEEEDGEKERPTRSLRSVAPDSFTKLMRLMRTMGMGDD